MADPGSPRSLDRAQKRAILDDGYTLLPGVVPRALVDRALRAINQSLGSEGLPPDQLPVYRARTYTPGLVRSPEVRGLLLDSPLFGLVGSVIGDGRVKVPSEGQIALRFPTPAPGSPAVPHIDGVSSPMNGVPAGTLYHFTALAGVFLNDVTEPDRGNLTVWPGSHRTMAAFLRQHGPAGLVGGFPRLDLAPPRPVLARAGDAILAHYQLAHGVAPNLGPHIRYAVFFRLFHLDHGSFGIRALHEPFLEWQGLNDL